MAMSEALLTGGLAPERDLFFAEKPADPEMRESTSMWLYEESGAFRLPALRHRGGGVFVG